jgi:hypothetical protein
MKIVGLSVFAMLLICSQEERIKQFSLCLKKEKLKVKSKWGGGAEPKVKGKKGK